MSQDISISIVITARNYAHFLKECIVSCLNQTIKPLEVIYSDDFSTDNSIEVAKSCGIKVISQKKHVGVIVARNAGVEATKGNVLIHVDGDDKLNPDYIEKCLQVFDETTPFVYCAAHTFGTKDIFWKVYAWETSFLWNRNFVNTSAMMWKDAFLKAGGWKETVEKTMWDWSLALRMSRLGTPKKSSAVLEYRQHSESWSHGREKTEEHFIPLTESIRRELVNMTIGLVYSGRIKGFLKKWMDCLIMDIKTLSNKPQFIIINNSEEDLNYVKKDYSKYFSEIRIITGEHKIKYTTEVERRNKVCELLSECYNRILENANGELIHLREDDIIPNEGCFQKLFYFVTSGAKVKAAVAGLYFNRNPKWQKIVGGRFDKNDIKKTQDFENAPSKKPFIVDFTGTGFLTFWKDLCPRFSPYVYGIQAHDWAWGLNLKQMGRELWMLPDAVCKHYQDSDNFVIPPEKFDITPTNNYTKIRHLREIVLKSVKL